MFVQTGDAQVFTDELDDRQAHLDKGGAGRATAERFDTYAAGAGEEIQKAGILNAPGEDIEECGLDAINDRPGARCFWTFQLTPFGGSCHNTHAMLPPPQSAPGALLPHRRRNPLWPRRSAPQLADC